MAAIRAGYSPKTARATGLIFSNFTREHNVIAQDRAMKFKFGYLSVGLDTAYSENSPDTFAFIYIGITDTGKVVILDDTKSDGPYPLLSESMAAGLFHPNCRHTMTTFFPGITKLPEISDEDKANKTYKAKQDKGILRGRSEDGRKGKQVALI